MPLEALLISENLTDSDSDGIRGGTGCNFIFSNSAILHGYILLYLLDTNVSSIPLRTVLLTDIFNLTYLQKDNGTT